MPKEKAFEHQQMVSLCTFVPWRLTLHSAFCRKLLRWFFCLALLASGFGLLAGCETKAPAPPQEALVAQVIDGDTLVLAESGQRVRLLGIDAPEMGKAGKPPEFMAHESKAFLAEMAQGKKLRLEYDRVRYDHYGRLLAYLFLSPGVMVNAELVRRGLAHVYCIPPNFRYREALLTAQREALEARRGVWQQRLKQDESYYLANRNSWILHRPACPLGQKTAPANRVRLTSLKDAYLQGFSPCRSCKP
jgi:micrococcal nuclease